MDEKPKLIELNTKHFLGNVLKDCKLNKENYNNLVFNVSAFIFFILLFLLIFYYKYKGKLTPLEKEKKEKQKQEYILSTLKKLQDIRREKRQELITNLPKWDDEIIKY